MMLGLIDWSYDAFSPATVMPAYVPWSEKNASTDGTAARRSAPAALLFARSRKLRYEGIAMAVRIARMIITTRSSIRVKPFSLLIRFRNLSSMVLLPWGMVLRWPRTYRRRAVERLSPRTGEIPCSDGVGRALRIAGRDDRRPLERPAARGHAGAARLRPAHLRRLPAGRTRARRDDRPRGAAGAD